MRSITHFFLFCFFLSFFAAADIIMPSEAEAQSAEIGIGNGILNRTSNIRSTPFIEPGNIAQVLPQGTQVQIWVKGEGWSLVAKDNRLLGWIVSWLVSGAQAQVSESVSLAPVSGVAPSAAPAPAEKSVYGIVQLNSNVRQGPMQTILEVLPRGSKVQILQERDNWYEIEYNAQKTGWIASWLVEQTQNPVAVANVVNTQEVGVVPATINTAELNQYWLGQINELRREKGLRELVLSDKLAATAAEWADYLGRTRQFTHDRSDGSSMHGWAEQQGVPFAERYSPGGWETNYFTENIARGITTAYMEQAKQALDGMLTSFLSQYNGPHYRTVYHPDWNSVGAGFYFDPLGQGNYRLYGVFHYGSLAL